MFSSNFIVCQKKNFKFYIFTINLIVNFKFSLNRVCSCVYALEDCKNTLNAYLASFTFAKVKMR